jgi:hypothetical protein
MTGRSIGCVRATRIVGAGAGAGEAWVLVAGVAPPADDLYVMGRSGVALRGKGWGHRQASTARRRLSSRLGGVKCVGLAPGGCLLGAPSIAYHTSIPPCTAILPWLAGWPCRRRHAGAAACGWRGRGRLKVNGERSRRFCFCCGETVLPWRWEQER